MEQATIIKRINQTILYLLAGIVSLIFLIPFIWVLFTSLKADSEIFRVPITIFPEQIVLSQYRHVLFEMSEFTIYFINTIIVCGISLGLVLFLSSLAGYAFGCMRFRGNRLLLIGVLIILSIPYAVYLMPIFIMESRLDLLDTHLGLILPYTALNLPLAIFIMRGTFRNIPLELQEAALVDGANHFQIWSRIMLPIAVPGVASAGIFTFVFLWSEFMFARTLMLSKVSYTLSVGITFLQSEAQSWNFGVLAATIVLTLLPVTLVFLYLQRFLVAGIMEGAIKR